MSTSSFCADYHEDRRAFLAAVNSFAARTGRGYLVHTHPVDAQRDLSVNAVELTAARPTRLFVLCTGIHGIEGYAGSAIARTLLAEVLQYCDAAHTSLLLVHALNPYGFAHFVRVNANNVDLNRNCEAHGESLFTRDSSAFAALAPLLSPRRPCDLGTLHYARFASALGRALIRHGAQTLRQVSLGGQYGDPRGLFYGGARTEPEIGFFRTLFERVAQRHSEVLLADLHTGYGERAQAYPLFGQADSPSLREFVAGGVTDREGHNKTYTVNGDLVGYCYKTVKRLRPAGVFNGTVVEIGTHGLSTLAQMQDLFCVVNENQARLYGSADARTERAVRSAFRELFFPSEQSWQQRAVTAGARAVEQLLRARGYVR